MKMTLKRFVPIMIALPVLGTIFACNRSDGNDNNTCVAGSGGDLTIVAYPQHHTKPILNHSNYLDTVWVKYNTQDAPSNGVYDTMYVGEAGEDHVHLANLKCGNYYIYATGFDTTINQRVKGGIPYSTTQTSGELTVNVPVTEGD